MVYVPGDSVRMILELLLPPLSSSWVITEPPLPLPASRKR
jgi:hypothetical protein